MPNSIYDNHLKILWNLNLNSSVGIPPRFLSRSVRVILPQGVTKYRYIFILTFILKKKRN
jgi:hypothetical protein